MKHHLILIINSYYIKSKLMILRIKLPHNNCKEYKNAKK